MRKCRLGAALPKRNWSPQFLISKERKPRQADLGAQNTVAMTYWPTPKSPSRQELLRHYWHADMAHLLDAWPHVISWTAERKPVLVEMDGKHAPFTPDFEVIDRSGTYALRLIQGESSDRPERTKRRRALQDHYRDLGGNLEFTTQAEILQHPHLRLARDLFFYRYHDWPNDLPRQVAVVATSERPETLGELHECLGRERVTWEQLLSLVANGHIEIDLDSGLQPDTPVLACRIQGYGA